MTARTRAATMEATRPEPLGRSAGAPARTCPVAARIDPCCGDACRSDACCIDACRLDALPALPILTALMRNSATILDPCSQASSLRISCVGRIGENQTSAAVALSVPSRALSAMFVRWLCMTSTTMRGGHRQRLNARSRRTNSPTMPNAKAAAFPLSVIAAVGTESGRASGGSAVVLHVPVLS